MLISLNVLIVEDNSDDVFFLVRELQKGGYKPEYEVVVDAASMQAALQRHKWDIILCDFNLPNFNGLEALKILQQSGLDLPFIVVSGYIGEDAAVDIMKSGAHDVILKSNLKRLIPAVARELQEAANRLNRRKAEEALAQAKNELEHTNQLLKQYSRRIMQVQEEERKRIAFELHDDTAQYLSILKMQIDAILHSGKIQDPEVLEKLQFLEKDADRAFNDVRRYSHELRPSVLEHMGLRASLEQIADDINKLNHFKVEVEVEGEEPNLSEEEKLGFFRIAQEAINNVRKHAKANRANIKLSFHKEQIRMEVSDDGIGFNPKEAKVTSGHQGSLGMMSMSERADLIGASLEIISQIGTGTIIRVKKSL